MRSGIYAGTIVHDRPRGPRHRFAYDHRVLLVDLDELSQLDGLGRLLSVERANLMSFRRADYFGDPDRPLAECIRDEVEAQLAFRPDGPISQLAHVRTLGWLFNPITLYYCYERSGRTVVAVVAVVTNTPWKQSHAYVLPGAGTHHVAKELHVSPFFGMQQTYEITVTEPGDELAVRITTTQGDDAVFFVELRLLRRELTRRTLRQLLLERPLATIAVSVRIHLQAARLWAAGAKFHRHPRTLCVVQEEQ